MSETLLAGGKARKLGVLFVNTRSAAGADVAVHLTLIENFDPSEVRVFIATNRNAGDLEPTLARLARVPHLKTVVCDLGHELSGKGDGWAGRLLSAAKNLGALASLAHLAWFVHYHKIDVLHATDRPRDALFSTLLARLTGRRNIIHCHIKWFAGIGGATDWALRRCSGALAISRFTGASLREGGVPESKIYTALNSIDAARFDPARTPRGLLRQRFGIGAETPLIGIVSRVMVWKGHLELVAALALVRAAVPDARLVIVGQEDLFAAQDGESYEAQVRAKITELGLEDRVHWAGWQGDMPQVMADLDILAMPSWEEPFGLVVTEAMAMQRPVVGFASGALPEIITNGEEGLLVPQKNVAALAEALIALLRDPARRENMGRKGRARVLRDFTPQRQCAEVVEIYRRVLAGQPDTDKSAAVESADAKTDPKEVGGEITTAAEI